MHGSLRVLSEFKIRKRGIPLHGREEIFPQPKFGRVARVLWPHKTAAHLAALCGVTERTAKNWLAGDTPSAAALLVVINEMMVA